MNIAIDLLLCLLASFIVIKYTLKGFVRAAFSALRLVLAIIAAYIFAPYFGHSQPLQIAASYLVTFCAAYVLLSVVAFAVDRLFDLPILKTANRLLGFSLGAACAYFALSVTVSLISVLLNFASPIFGMSAEELTNATCIYKYFIGSGIFPNI